MDIRRAGRDRRTSRVRAVLVAAEFALALPLLVSACWFLQSLWRLQAVDPGFRSDHTLSMRLELPQIQMPSTVSPTFLERGWGEEVLHGLAQRIGGVPGVEGVSFTDDIFVDTSVACSATAVSLPPLISMSASVAAGRGLKAMAERRKRAWASSRKRTISWLGPKRERREGLEVQMASPDLFFLPMALLPAALLEV